MHFAKDKEQPVKHKERQKTWVYKTFISICW